MKEARYFYAPDAQVSNELPAEEAAHALRVLRLAVRESTATTPSSNSCRSRNIGEVICIWLLLPQKTLDA